MKLYIIKRSTYLILFLVGAAYVAYLFNFIYNGIFIAELSNAEIESARNDFKVVAIRANKDQNLEYTQLSESYLNGVLAYIDAKNGQKSIIDGGKLNQLFK